MSDYCLTLLVITRKKCWRDDSVCDFTGTHAPLNKRTMKLKVFLRKICNYPGRWPRARFTRFLVFRR